MNAIFPLGFWVRRRVAGSLGILRIFKNPRKVEALLVGTAPFWCSSASFSTLMAINFERIRSLSTDDG